MCAPLTFSAEYRGASAMRQYESRHLADYRVAHSQTDRWFSAVAEPLSVRGAFLPGGTAKREGSGRERGEVRPAQLFCAGAGVCGSATVTLHCGSKSVTSRTLGLDIISLSRPHSTPAWLPERYTDQPQTIPGGPTDSGLPRRRRGNTTRQPDVDMTVGGQHTEPRFAVTCILTPPVDNLTGFPHSRNDDDL